MDSIKTCFVYVISLKLLSAILAVIFPVLGLLNYTSSYWILGFALPLTLMIWYLNKGRVVVKGLTIDNQVIFGNSCYYLGFLFTIATLIISLFMLGSEEFNVGTISLQFATAMITTLIGMCARIYYVTFSKYDNYKNGVTLVIPPGKTLGNSSSQRNPSDNGSPRSPRSSAHGLSGNPNPIPCPKPPAARRCDDRWPSACAGNRARPSGPSSAAPSPQSAPAPQRRWMPCEAGCPYALFR